MLILKSYFQINAEKSLTISRDALDTPESAPELDIEILSLISSLFSQLLF